MAGIDSIVNTRADAFTNNPQGLMQRYAMGQDLLDLLALQKLKQDKEAAARSLQMNMQTPQGTIKDQLQGQVMDMTKREVVQAVAPGLQQQGQRMAAQQAQNMIGAGLPTQPAPALQGMAQGGIVGYADGGTPYSRSALDRFDERRRAERGQSGSFLRRMGEAEMDRAYAENQSAELIKEDPSILALMALGAVGPELAPLLARLAPLLARVGTRANPVLRDIAKYGDDLPSAASLPQRVFDPRQAVGAAGVAGIGALLSRGDRSPDTNAIGSGESTLRDVLNRVNVAPEENRQATPPSGTPEKNIPVSMDALRRFDERRRAETDTVDADSPESAPPASERRFGGYSPTTKGPEMSLEQAIKTARDFNTQSLNLGPGVPPGLRGDLDTLRYQNALRVLSENGITERDLAVDSPLGVGSTSLMLMDQEGLGYRLERLNRDLATVQAYEEYGLPPPRSMPNADVIKRQIQLTELFAGNRPGVPTPQPTTATASQPTTQAAPQPTTATTPQPTTRVAPTARPAITAPTEEGLAALFNDMTARAQQPAQQPTEQPKYRSRYEDRLAEIEAEKQNRMGALIDFLQAAGASGGTNLGATLMGGGSGLRAREERLRQQETDALKSIIEDEQAQQAMGFRERELVQRAEQAAADRALQASIAAADNASAERRTAAQVTAGLEEVQSRLDATMYQGAAEAKAEQLNPVYIRSNYPELVAAYAEEWKRRNKGPGVLASAFTDSDKEYEEQATQEGVRKAMVDVERQINSFFGTSTSSGGAPGNSTAGGNITYLGTE